MKVTITRKNKERETHRVMELTALLEAIKTGVQSEPVEDLRYNLRFTSPEVIPTGLQKLSRINFTTHFRRKEGTYLFTGYNGLVPVTFEKLSGMQEAALLRNKAIRFPPCKAAFIGSSGHTVKLLFAFTRPDGTLPDTEPQAEIFHAHAYRWAVSYLQAQLPDYSIRLQKPTLESAWRFSYDPELCYKEQAYPILLDQPLDMPPDISGTTSPGPEKGLLEKMVPGIERYRYSSFLFETSFSRAIRKVGLTEKCIKEKLFLECLAENCYGAGIPEEEATQWSVIRFWDQVEEVVIRETFRNIYSLRKVFGQKLSISPKQSLYLQTEEFMNRCYEFRYNKQSAGVEYRQKNSFFFDFKEVDDRVINSIAVRAMSEGIDIWDKDVKRWINSDKVPVYKPIEEFILKLPDWDGVDRITAFAQRVKCSNPHWPKLFYRWFLGMTAQWIGRTQKYANATVPVLIGAQGCGKSTFCRTILPPELHSYYTDRIDFTMKRDAELYLNRFALINMDEFDQISPKEQAFLKHILQKPVVNTRKPHRTTIQALCRYASFIGTSNHPDLLTDTSGNRRYICIRVEDIIDNLSPVNYYQLYAQAFRELRRGTTHWFSGEDEALITEFNREFEQRGPLEQLFLQYFRIPSAGENPQKLLAVEILETLRKKSGIKLSNTSIMNFGRVLKKLGVVMEHTRTGNKYLVVGNKEEREKNGE